MGMHDDVAIGVNAALNLYEQQSSYNPNMPLRMLQYTANLFEQYVVKHNRNKYGRRLIDLPVPKLIVLYNGTREMPDETVLQLSDAFPEALRQTSDIEVRVRMINVNLGRSPSILSNCTALYEYAWTVDGIRRREKALEGTVAKQHLLETAIDHTIDVMPDDFLLKPYLEAHRAEVKGMLLTEYNEEKVMELFREEGREEGRVEGFDLLGKLIRKLWEQGRINDVVRVTNDPVYRNQLFREFGLA